MCCPSCSWGSPSATGGSGNLGAKGCSAILTCAPAAQGLSNGRDAKMVEGLRSQNRGIRTGVAGEDDLRGNRDYSGKRGLQLPQFLDILANCKGCCGREADSRKKAAGFAKRSLKMQRRAKGAGEKNTTSQLEACQRGWPQRKYTQGQHSHEVQGSLDRGPCSLALLKSKHQHTLPASRQKAAHCSQGPSR